MHNFSHRASAFVHRFQRSLMVTTPEVRVLVKSEAKVRCMAVSEEGILAWVEGQQQVFLAALDEAGQLVPHGSMNHEHPVTYLGFFHEHLIVGDDLDGFVLYTAEGRAVEAVKVDGGIVNASFLPSDVCFLSGMGRLLRWNPQQGLKDLSEAFGLGEVLSMASHQNRVYLATQQGEVMCLEGETVTWRRPSRGEHGERITALGVTENGGFFLTREGHALVAGDEEAIEFEFWVEGTLLSRSERSGRMLTSGPRQGGAVVGFDDGSVSHLGEDGALERVMETHHPVMACFATGEHTLASSWFYIHGTNGDRSWMVEHQGMPNCLLLHPSKTAVVFAGDDQNDYTSSEPIGFFSLDGPYSEVDRAELNLWFQLDEANTKRSAEVIYGDSDDVLEHLTHDERKDYLATAGEREDLTVLLDAMGEVVASGEEPHERGMTEDDEEALFEQLSGLNDMAMEGHDALFDALNEPLSSVHRPQAVAGDDQHHVAGEDGTAVVHLDGRGTNDPHAMIARWSWHNDRGEELAVGSQLKLRLPLGRHRFELRLVDRDGSWTTDSLVVEVVPASTS